MKRTLFWAAALFFCAWTAHGQDLPVAPYLPAMEGPQAQNAPITVQFPQENMTVLRGARNVYLFGKLNVPNAVLDINGQKVPVNKNGTFITFLPVEQGTFSFVLTAQTPQQIYQAVRHIIVPGMPITHFEGEARFDETEVYPAKPLWVLPGDTVNLSVRGTPNAQVTAALDGLKHGKNIKLKEDTRTPGLYRAKYIVHDKEKPRTAKITYQLYDPASDTKAKITAPERVRVLDTQELRPARITAEGDKLRQIPVQQGSLYPYYRTYGQALIDGRDKGLYRLNLGNGEKGWLEEKKLEPFSAGKYSPNILADLHTFSDEKSTRVFWRNAKQVPVSVHEFANRMEITFYYTPQFLENFSLDATSPVLDRVEWSGPQDGVIKFVLYFKENEKIWGHAYRYEENDFVLELRHRPQIAPQKNKPLAGARILIDAGHSPRRKPPYDGLVSPSGVLEYEANLTLAEALKPKLEAAGATVIMTRQGNNHMNLPARYRMALEQDAHIFVSLHHNALPDTVNPLAAPRGYSVYYTYPHSFDLAESVYQAFNRLVPLPDNGLIANDVLFIPRIPEMPSILVENAFMILPEQEELVLSPKGREIFANALYQGILDFYRPPAPKRSKAQGKKR